MKRAAVLALLLLALLSGCGGGQAASRGAVNNSGTVSQLLEDAAKGGAGAEPALPPVPLQPAEPEPAARQPLPPGGADSDVDVDLTRMSGTMVYAEVSNMMNCPDDYIGKTVRMRGQSFNSHVDEATYHNVIIADATACCAQGIEYVLADESAGYPDDYIEVTVMGEFELYDELGMTYCRLKGAAVEAYD